MGFNCCICGRNIWFFQAGQRLTQNQEKKVTGMDRQATGYMDGEFAHQKCFRNLIDVNDGVKE